MAWIEAYYTERSHIPVTRPGKPSTRPPSRVSLVIFSATHRMKGKKRILWKERIQEMYESLVATDPRWDENLLVDRGKLLALTASWRFERRKQLLQP